MKNDRHIAGWLMLALLFCCLGSCSRQSEMQEQLVNIPKMEWSHEFKPWLDMDIADTTLAYNIYAVIRHTQQFKYNNLLVSYSFIRPGDSAATQQINLPLGNRQAWLGDTLGTIIESRIRINPKPVRLGNGRNSFVLSQLMPDEPLLGIVNIGIRVEAVR